MDKKEKKSIRQVVRMRERAAARAAFPLSVGELDALFAMLDKAVPVKGCDHTRRLTKVWLEQHGHPVDVTLAWLDTQGGFCDCEIVLNVEQRVQDALAGLRPWKPKLVP